VVIADGELSPAQARNLEDIVHARVVDRTALILDIFAQHAQSSEGKAQVELAQLAYQLPRLRGHAPSCPGSAAAASPAAPASASAAPARCSWSGSGARCADG